MTTKRPCTFDGCNKTAHARGWCGAHYQQWRLRGYLTPKTIGAQVRGLSKKQMFDALADRSPGCWKWRGVITSEGYGSIAEGGVQMYAHRLSYEMHKGPIPAGMVVDHTCHNRACVNPAHLQAVTYGQNNENRSGPPANNTSGVRGVSWDRKRGKWHGYVKARGKMHHVGFFDDIKEAEATVIAKRNEVHTNNLLDRRVAS